MVEKVIGIKAKKSPANGVNAYKFAGLRQDGVKCYYRLEDIDNKNGKLIIEIDIESSIYETTTETEPNDDHAYLYLATGTSNQISMNIDAENIFQVGSTAEGATLSITFGVTGKIGDTTGATGKIGDRTIPGKIGSDTTGPGE